MPPSALQGQVIPKMQDCGKCSLCCKLIEVPGLASAGEWCPHCDPGNPVGGCTIHSKRPSFCKNFHCFWRAEDWPEWLRPDMSGVIFESLPGVETVLVSVDPSQPDSWKEPGVRKVIEILRRKCRPVILRTKSDSMMFIPDGMGKDDILRDVRQVIDWQEKQKWQHQHTQQTLAHSI